MPTKASRARSPDSKSRPKRLRTQNVKSSKPNTKLSPTNDNKVKDSLSSKHRDNLKKLAQEIMAGGINKLKAEFEQLCTFNVPRLTNAAMMANLNKCRYKDVACWDSTRVMLNFPDSESNNFIHANYIKHEFLSNTTFICTQGPLEHTQFDFWRMVWQEQLNLIIMLSQCVEDGKVKCSQYWPKETNQTKKVGPFEITAVSVDATDPDIVVTKLSIQYEQEKRELEHKQWVTWPDKTAPKSSAVAFKLLLSTKEKLAKPVIHCSAGVGRSGTLIILELVHRQLLGPKGSSVNTMQLVKDMRQQRAYSMVQTEDQYVYIHFSFVQYAVMCKVLEKNAIMSFVEDYQRYIANLLKQAVVATSPSVHQLRIPMVHTITPRQTQGNPIMQTVTPRQPQENPIMQTVTPRQLQGNPVMQAVTPPHTQAMKKAGRTREEMPPVND